MLMQALSLSAQRRSLLAESSHGSAPARAIAARAALAAA